MLNFNDNLEVTQDIAKHNQQYILGNNQLL